MSKIQEKVTEFFASHPDATEVYEALGVLFIEKERAEKYLAGVAGRMVTTHTKDGVTFERESENLRHEIMHQENLVGQKHLDFEAAPPSAKEQAMSAWHKESRKLEDLQARLVKQVELESKEERIAKAQKPVPAKIEKKKNSKEELEAAISAQEAIISTNEKMIALMKGQKKKKAEAAQQIEVKILEGLKSDLATSFPVEEEKTVGDAGDDTGAIATDEADSQ